MRLWRVVLLVNLALAAGLFLGYLAWGRQIPRLEEELALSRERGAFPGVEQVFTGQGVVRGLIPELNVVILTHEDIAGFMPSMTMGFKLHEPRLYQGLDIGATVRFTLKGVPPNMEIVAIAREEKP